MIVIKNKFIPFPGFKCINLFGVLFTKEQKLSDIDINHEAIHSRLMFEMLVIPYYIWYVIEWIVKLIKYNSKAYRNISFEREAYLNQNNLNYLNTRNLFSWIKYL